VRAVVLVALAGCSFPHGKLSPGDDGPPSEAGVDAPELDAFIIDAPPSCMQWAAKHFDACAIPAPMGDLTLVSTLSPYTYTTTNAGGVLTDKNGATIAAASASIMQTGGPAAALLSVGSLTINDGAQLNVVGTKPLIIAAWTGMQISGTIDAGSHRGASARTGAGSGPSTLCTGNAAAIDGTNEATTGGGSGGGGGGGFRGQGGMGGPGDTGGENAGGGGGGAVVFPTYVRGGCSGAKSGKAGPDASVTTPSDDNTQAPGGSAGGAIQLTSRGPLQVTGTGRVLAGGAGGEGAPLHSAVGGGGGGSGGYIGFDAAALQITGGAVIAANGGGAGASAGFATTGNPGNDGNASGAIALGGAAQTCANAGGSGGAGAILMGETASQAAQACGGGGGGGGVGFVGVFTGAGFTSAAIFSPAYQLNPF
jgi:hypothetical protein